MTQAPWAANTLSVALPDAGGSSGYDSHFTCKPGLDSSVRRGTAEVRFVVDAALS